MEKTVTLGLAKPLTVTNLRGTEKDDLYLPEDGKGKMAMLIVLAKMKLFFQ